ncbi:MAG TPA: L-seryl-tRNA(Sec) selenium transferase, partial [Planctomycetota bacterium]|nr:L-seryl-tRNA(Sec) selenium transferase [Planctomycetota bacterium]
VLRGGAGAAALAEALRAAPVPVLARIVGDGVSLDARTLLAGDFALVESALARALGTAPQS